MKQIFLLGILLILFSCMINKEPVAHYPINKNDIIDDSLAVFDSEITTDGNGSLLLESNTYNRIHLYEISNRDIENCHLYYSAKLKSELENGFAYLEMWCVLNGKEFFSRSLHQKVSGKVDWKKIQTPFLLQQGQNPEMIKLNLVIEGKGKIWIDEINLEKQSINSSS